MDKENRQKFFYYYFNVSVPQKLYHYTNCDAFLGIVENSEFWASHIKYMNDNTEAELAYKLLKEKIKLKSKNKSEKLTQKVFDAIDAAFKTMDVFIVSFSKEYDDLNQWRGYANTIPSYCLTIRTKNLPKEILTPKKISEINDIVSGEKPSGNKQIFLLPCLYDSVQHSVLLEDILKKIEKANSQNETVEIAKQFIYYAPLIKDETYKSEKEWRMIIYLFKDFQNKLQDNEIKFRKGKSYIVPFYKQKLPKNCISEVTIGACPDKEIQNKATKYFLSRYDNFKSAKVFQSSIPFRNW